MRYAWLPKEELKDADTTQGRQKKYKKKKKNTQKILYNAQQQ